MTSLPTASTSDSPDATTRDSGLRRRIAHGVGWTSLALFGNRALTWITTLIVAWILEPKQFGLVGFAWIVYGAALLFRDQTTSGLIVHGDDSRQSHNQVFWVTLLASVVLGVCVVGISPLVTDWTGVNSLPLLAFFATAFVISTLGVVPGAILQRRLQFARLSLAEIASSIAFTLVAVPATLLLGVTGIGVAQLLGAAVGVVAVLIAVPFLPSFRAVGRAPGGAARYGMSTLVLTVAIFGYTNLDTVVVAVTRGQASLGQYILAFNLAYVASLTITMVMSRVAFPAFSVVACDSGRLRALYERALLATGILVVPVAVSIVFFGPVVVDAIFGSDYSRAAGPLRWLAGYGAAASVAAVSFSYLRAVSKIPLAIAVVALQYVIAVGAMSLLLGAYAMSGVAIGVTAGAVAGALILTILCLRDLGAEIGELRHGGLEVIGGVVLLVTTSSIGESLAGTLGMLTGFLLGLTAYGFASLKVLRRFILTMNPGEETMAV